jgi:hypothetical protein
MWWLPKAAIRQAAHGHGGGAYIPHPSTVVTDPAQHNSVTGGVILLLVLIVPAALLFLGGVAAGLRNAGRDRDNSTDSEVSRVMTRHSVTSTGAPVHPRSGPGVSKSPLQGSSRELQLAVTLFQSCCDDCGAVRNQPCKLVVGRKSAVVSAEWNWTCHVSRIYKGCKENPRLYLELVGAWQGPFPEELRGLHQN